MIPNGGNYGSCLEAAPSCVPTFSTPVERGAAVYHAGCPPSLPGGPSAAEQLIKRLIINLSGSDSWTEPLPMNDRGHVPLAAAKSGRTSTVPPAPPHRANLAAGRKSPAASTAIAFCSSSYTAADFTSCARVRVQRRCLQQIDCGAPNNIREHFFHEMPHSHLSEFCFFNFRYFRVNDGF